VEAHLQDIPTGKQMLDKIRSNKQRLIDKDRSKLRQLLKCMVEVQRDALVKRLNEYEEKDNLYLPLYRQ
jgi:hypothetical protein